MKTTPRTLILFLTLWTAIAAGAADALKRPEVGDTAPDFTLKSIKGDAINLTKMAANGTVVLVVLRGYPGYQCPICTKQIGAFIGKADEFKTAGAKVILVYPGPAAELEKRAEEFTRNIVLPEPFVMVTDPDYVFTNAYNLRWNAPRETAYPSTFVLNKERNILYAKISMTHGDRAPVTEVLAKVKP